MASSLEGGTSSGQSLDARIGQLHFPSDSDTLEEGELDAMDDSNMMMDDEDTLLDHQS